MKRIYKFKRLLDAKKQMTKIKLIIRSAPNKVIRREKEMQKQIQLKSKENEADRGAA